MPRVRRRRLGAHIVNWALFTAACLVMVCVCECVFRARYAHYFYAPDESVERVQSRLRLEPELGFTWQPGINYWEAIVLDPEAAKERRPLRTDAHGFLNPPEAIDNLAAGQPVEVCGLGDSFMEHACEVFHDCFEEAGFFYYSCAIHRQAPPQYELILQKYALPLRPKWVVCGLYENDFAETRDFELWKASGLDWFTYHSGTWCGPPIGENHLSRMVSRHLRGFRAFGWVLAERCWGYIAETKAGANPVSPDVMAAYIGRMHTAAQAQGARLLLLIIPGKKTILEQPTAESHLCDDLVHLLQKDGQPDVLDLRPVFRADSEPSRLYYKDDGHWNKMGAALAAQTVRQYLTTQHSAS